MRHSDNDSGPVVISGGTGFIGQALAAALHDLGHQVIVLSRSEGSAPNGSRRITYDQLADLQNCHAVINLAGENIAGARWSAARKKALRDSRIKTTTRLCEWVDGLSEAPAVFISGSAIGYYGATGETAATEESPPGQGFAAQLCDDWEKSVSLPPATRAVFLRIGVVLGPGGGALQRMLLPFRLGLGGPIGSGQQWMSWVSRHDLIRIMLDAMDQTDMQGAYNAVSPQPVRNADFARALANALKRPAVLPMPAAVLRLLMGEMSELLLDSQKILPARLQAQGFVFEHAALNDALAHALS